MPVADRAADDGAEARQPGAGRFGRAAGDARDAGGDAGARSCAGRACAGIGRRLRRSRAARPYDGGDDRRRRDIRRRRAPAGRRGARASRPRAARRSAPKEGLALLNGTQFSTANALAALFEAEILFRSALATGALSTDAARGSDAPFDPRIHRLRGHRGQIEAADALRALMRGQRDPRLASHRRRARSGSLLPALPAAGDGRGARRAAPGGADAGDRGQRRHRQSADLRRDDAALSGGNFHAEPVAFAADMMALAICEIGSLAERRIAMLVDPALSGLPAFLTPKPGLNSGFMIPQVTAAALVSENKSRAYPASVDSIPTSANQEDHVSMAAHGARRLLPMVENASAIIGIELLAAAQGCDFHAPLTSSPPLEAVRALVRGKIPHLDDDRHFHPDIAGGDRPRAQRRRHRGGGRRCAAFGREFARTDLRSSHERQSAHRQCPHHPRAARPRDYRQKLADRSADAHADEQSRSRSRGEARASSSSMAASAAPRATGTPSTRSSPR